MANQSAWRLIHPSINILPALLLFSEGSYDPLLRDAGGRLMSPGQAKLKLAMAKYEGKKVLPAIECNNFDFIHGCQGHLLDEKVE